MHTHIARSSLPGASSSVTPSLISPCCSNPLATTKEDVLLTPDTTASNFRFNGASASTCLYIHMSGGPTALTGRPAVLLEAGRPHGPQTSAGAPTSENDTRLKIADMNARTSCKDRHRCATQHLCHTWLGPHIASQPCQGAQEVGRVRGDPLHTHVAAPHRKQINQLEL